MTGEVSTRLYPKATKTSLVKLLRSKGWNVPSIRKAIFSHFRQAFWLEWSDGVEWHKATYSSGGGKPYLYVDSKWIDLTMAEVIHFGMVEEK